MDREVIEAHFTLHGWEPGLWMGRGAARKNDVVVETFRTPPRGVKMALLDARTSSALDGPNKVWAATRGWCMDDHEFDLMAPLIQAADDCQHETIGTGGAPMRCTACHQLVTR